MCSQTGQGSHTRLRSGSSFLGDSIVGYPGGHGSLVGQAHEGHEPVCHSCQTCNHPA